jgi:hypothetical protein
MNEVGIRITGDASGLVQASSQGTAAMEQLPRKANDSANSGDRSAESIGKVAHYGLAGGGMHQVRELVSVPEALAIYD